MTLHSTDKETRRPGTGSLSPLQLQAWMVANAAYHRPNGDVYRAAGRALYQQALHERILDLFARSDEQNARLDAITLRRTQGTTP